ncbi:MAG: hypothetical protein HRT44_02450 [Bdellovibrionales bacterium]|nr:hypothetical protein [Bdellovibrionales bacterium]NQZ18108.1 hypothetical protein [Bdellovibrionales bacterium]
MAIRKNIFALLGSIFLLSGCDTSLSEAVNMDVSFFSKSDVALFEIISNSTLDDNPYCVESNKIKIKVSLPGSEDYQCWDNSTLSADAKLGLTCESGVEVKDITVNGEWKSCKEMTLCGIKPTSKTTLEERYDGGLIEEWTFENLPWSCSAEVYFGKKEDVANEKYEKLSINVVAPKCPFCKRLNKYTCAKCDELTDNEEVTAGLVIQKDCQGAACKSCPNDGDTVPHRGSFTFYKKTSASCGESCVEQSLVRVCNDGFFEGNPAFQHKQCIDAACGCQIPGKAITYESGKTLSLYKKDEIECGVTCSKIDVQCTDGKWYHISGANKDKVVETSVLTAHNEESCSARNTCRCNYDINGQVSYIPANGQRSFFRFNGSSCSEPKNCYTKENYLRVKCSATGEIDSFDSNTFKFVSCRNPTCTCYIDGTRVDAGETVYRYKKKIANEGETCTSLAAQFTCEEGGKWTGAENGETYPYVSCESESDSGTLGGTGGGTGNDDGPGAALKARFGLGDGGGGGGPCIDGTKCRANITDAHFSGYRKTTCPLPWGGGEVGHYGSIIAFDQKCVVKPGKCEKHRQSRTCAQNGLTGDSKYKFETCEEKASCP